MFVRVFHIESSLQMCNRRGLISCEFVESPQVACRSVINWAAFYMIIFGIVGKVGAAFATIPDPVIGGCNEASNRIRNDT